MYTAGDDVVDENARPLRECQLHYNIDVDCAVIG